MIESTLSLHLLNLPNIFTNDSQIFTYLFRKGCGTTILKRILNNTNKPRRFLQSGIPPVTFIAIHDPTSCPNPFCSRGFGVGETGT